MSADDPAPHRFMIKLFGGFDVQVAGTTLPKLRSRKEQWLLALLTLKRDHPVARAWLAQTLWPFPDHSVEQAAYNLRRGLTGLRKALGPEAHRLQAPTPPTLCLDLHGAEVDVVSFDAAITHGDPASLERAVSLYTGPLLLECTEEWAIAERRKREQQYLQALKALSARAATGGDDETAVRYLRQAVAVDPFWEPAQGALMEALAQSGDVGEALQVYQEFSRLLHRDRDAVPGAETTVLYHTLRAQIRARAPLRPPAPESPLSAARPVHRLPVPLTSLIGREAELREIETRFRQLRLLTLTGASGVGKTRLAIQLAETLAPEFRDGVCFVDLGALTDPAHVTQMAASALEVPEEPGRPLAQTLADFLHARQLLLVLDNCEHLIGACARLAETLLQHSRALRLLATSRQSLGVGGEGIWRVASLSLPDPQRLPADPAQLADLLPHYAAIQLFVERAAQAQPAFRLTPQNARAVEHLCRQLDGIPLALELAAARVSVLPVEQIAQRLDNRFRLLTTGPRTALSRQQTLEAAMKWSFDLLSEAEFALLCALSVFAGGWTLEAAEEIGAAVEIPPSAVLDILAQLVDKSLVLYEDHGAQARYRLLETVRQYSRERLLESGKAPAVAERHLDRMIRLAEAADPHLQKPDQVAWLRRLEQEHENLRVALEGSLTAPGSAAKSLRLAGTLWRFWHRRGYLTEGRGYLANALAQESAASTTPERAKACHGAGMLAFLQGDTASARRLFEESLAISRELQDRRQMADVLYSLAQMEWYRGDNAAARPLFMEALAIHRALDDKAQAALTLSHLGIVASDQKDLPSARRFFEESLAISRELNDRALIANVLHSLGHMAFYQDDYDEARRIYGEELKLARSLEDRNRIATALHRLGSVEYKQEDFEAARRLFEESLAISRELEDKSLVSAALYSLGNTARAQADYTAARAFFAERLAISQDLGDRPGLSYTLDAFAGLLAAQQQTYRAIVLYSAAYALREALGAPLSPINQEEQPTILAARSLQGEQTFALAWEEGSTMPLEQALQYALEEAQ